MLRLEGISKQFSSIQACSNITLHIAKGEFFSLLGPSGCGKTTLLKIISGLLEPDAGTLSYDGQCLNAVPAHKRNVNTVFQNYALFPHLSVIENVAFGLRMKHVPETEIRKRVAEMFEMMELAGFEQRKPHQLSGGQQQRVALARALVNRPDVLLLDEPLAALDVKLRKQMQLELRHLQQKLRMTFIYVTHDQEEAMRMSDRIAVMNHGIVDQVGTPEEIYNKPRTRFVAGFIGETNFLGSASFTPHAGRAELHLPGHAPLLGKIQEQFQANSRLTFAVRPEKIRIHRNGYTPAQGENVLAARIDEVLYLGTMHHVTTTTASGQSIKVVCQSSETRTPYRPGDVIHLAWDTEHTIAIAD